jgi:hypothetical protein
MCKLSILRLAMALSISGALLLPSTDSFAAQNWLEKLFSSATHKAPKHQEPRGTKLRVKTPVNAPVPEAKPEPMVGEDGLATPSEVISAPSDNPLASAPFRQTGGPIQQPSLSRSTPTKPDFPAGRNEVDAGAALPVSVPIPEPNPRAASSRVLESGLTRNMTPVDTPPQPMQPDPRMDERSAPSGAMPAEEVACRIRLETLSVKFENQSAESDASGCSVPYPLLVTSLGSEIRVVPGAEMNCAMAEVAAHFMQKTVSPLANAEFGQSLKSLHASAYACRPRNGTNKLSEHAFGNALDISSFTLSGGTTVAVEAQPAKKPAAFLAKVRKAACGPFKTVLGPGNPDHSEHFHFDLAARRGSGAVCE